MKAECLACGKTFESPAPTAEEVIMCPECEAEFDREHPVKEEDEE